MDAFREVEYSTVYGKLITGDYVTFTEPFPIRRRQSSNGTAVLELATNLLFAGSDTTSIDTEFRSAEVVVPYLSAWLTDRAFDGDVERQEGNWVSSALHVSRTHFDEFVPAVSGGFRLRMSSTGSSTEEADRYELSNFEMLHVRPKSKKTVNYYRTTTWELMQYFSLMSKHPFEINSLVLREKKSRDEQNQIYDSRFAVVYPAKRSKETRKQKVSDIIFHQAEVKSRKRTTLRRLFSASAGLSTALSIFHSIRLEPPSIDLKLILLVQAYEAAFSEKNSGRMVSKTKFKEVKKLIIAAIPEHFIAENPNFIEGINRALGHANSRPLKDKMIGQLEGMNEKVVDRIFIDDYSASIRRIVATRNYVTHRAESSKTTEVVLGPELINLVESLYWLIWYLLMKDLGFTNSRLTKKIIDHGSFDESNRARVQLSVEEDESYTEQNDDRVQINPESWEGGVVPEID